MVNNKERYEQLLSRLKQLISIEKKDLTSSEVLKISRELDSIIVEEQKAKNKEKTENK